MWTRKITFLINFKCCRDEVVEGYGEGKDWFIRMPIQEDTDYPPVGSLFKWARKIIESSRDSLEFLANQECERLFPGNSHLEFCENSITISEGVIEQFIDGRRTSKDSIMKTGWTYD